ncbi:glycosyltransferase family 2 protein [Photobacterium piscicola]|uniref:glycosyltransferase family 2 protein n=1 Tax=Photobacterium piscicola TaxID=1378299 RepID=UPI0038D13FAB
MTEEKIPKLSVILPVFNAEEFVVDAIDSVLNQSFPDFELIIIDDCSTDKTYDLLIKKENEDSRIKVYKNERNLKLIKTLNFGLSVARGEYIVRMDADDICNQFRFSEQYECIKKTGAVIVGSNYNIFGTKKRKIKLPEDNLSCKLALLTCSPFCHPSVMLDLNKIRKFNINYNDNYPHAEDFEFFIRLSQVGEVYNIQKPLLYYRYHNAQVSNVYSKEQMESRVKAIIKHYNFSDDLLISQIIEYANLKKEGDKKLLCKGLLELLFTRNEKLNIRCWANIFLWGSIIDIIKYLIKVCVK